MRFTSWMALALLVGSIAPVYAEDEPNAAETSAAHLAFWALVRDEDYTAAAAAIVPDASVDTEGARRTVRGSRRVQAEILKELIAEFGAPRDFRPIPEPSEDEVSWIKFQVKSEDDAPIEALQAYSTEYFEADFPYIGKGYAQSTANAWRVLSYAIGFSSDDEEVMPRVMSVGQKVSRSMRENYEEGSQE